MNPYDKTTHDGKTVDWLTHCALLEAEIKLGYRLTIVQGSYHPGVGASAGTHDGGGCVDLSPWDWENKVHVLRSLGWAIWHRTPIPGVWGEHIHGVLIGNEKLAPLARSQVTNYFNHTNGLKGQAADPTWHPNPIPTYRWPGSDAALALEKRAAELLDGAPVVSKPVTVERRAVDYSFSRPSLAAIKAAGYLGVGRYIGGTTTKRLTKAEAAQIHARGLGVWLVYESTAGRALAGKAAGAADVKDAEAQATALEYPADAVIFYAVDTDATAAQVSAYFAGVREGARRYAVGDYGGIKITEGNLSDWHWQASAWSGGKLSPKAHIYQRVKPNGNLPAGCDENVLIADFPAWHPTIPEDDMPLSDADIAKVAAAVAKIPVQNKDAAGVLENTGTLAGMVSRLDIANNQNTAQLAALGTKLDQVATLLQAAIDSGKS